MEASTPTTPDARGVSAPDLPEGGGEVDHERARSRPGMPRPRPGPPWLPRSVGTPERFGPSGYHTGNSSRPLNARLRHAALFPAVACRIGDRDARRGPDQPRPRLHPPD